MQPSPVNASRRGFLKGLAGILAAGSAPAFVRAASLMPSTATNGGALFFRGVEIEFTDGQEAFPIVWSDGATDILGLIERRIVEAHDAFYLELGRSLYIPPGTYRCRDYSK